MNKKCFYTFEAMLYIACMGDDKAASLQDICHKVGVAGRYLEQVMQKLVHAGILRGIRGPQGGYVLAKEKRKIRLYDIYNVIDKDLDNQMDINVSELRSKVTIPLAGEIEKNTLNFLKTITINDLLERANGAGILEKMKSKDTNFNI